MVGLGPVVFHGWARARVFHGWAGTRGIPWLD